MGEVGAFVFVTHWPLAIKSFYMRQCDDGSGESESFDLLAPRVGELLGGSMHFDDLAPVRMVVGDWALRVCVCWSLACHPCATLLHSQYITVLSLFDIFWPLHQ